MIMASNSDSIYYVLSKLKKHPELIISQHPQYSNAIVITFSDQMKVADSEFYFPKNKLLVNRLAPSFVAKNGALLDYFFQLTGQSNPGYHDVWITTSHVTKAQQYLIDLSYE